MSIISLFFKITHHSAFHKGLTAVKDGDVYWCPNKGMLPICGYYVSRQYV